MQEDATPGKRIYVLCSALDPNIRQLVQSPSPVTGLLMIVLSLVLLSQNEASQGTLHSQQCPCCSCSADRLWSFLSKLGVHQKYAHSRPWLMHDVVQRGVWRLSRCSVSCGARVRPAEVSMQPPLTCPSRPRYLVAYTSDQQKKGFRWGPRAWFA